MLNFIQYLCSVLTNQEKVNAQSPRLLFTTTGVSFFVSAIVLYPTILGCTATPSGDAQYCMWLQQLHTILYWHQLHATKKRCRAEFTWY